MTSRLLPLAALVLITGSATAQRTDTSPVAVPASTPTVYDAPALVKQFQASITADELAAHLYLFASDLFEGRETATRGQKLAAQYLAAQYRKMGVRPAGTAATDNPRDPAAYMQPFSLYGRRLKEATLEIGVGTTATYSAVFSSKRFDGGFYPESGGQPETIGSVVFGGYGIQDEGLGYDDYTAMTSAGIDFEQHWLMILADEPLVDAKSSRLPTEDGGPSSWSTERQRKFSQLFRNGVPKGILIVGDSSPRNDASFGSMAADAAAAVNEVDRLSTVKPGSSGRSVIPTYVVSTAFANRILTVAGETIESLQGKIAGDLTPRVFVVPEVTLTSRIENEVYETTSENVLAIIEGSDPMLKHEYVVISSHYDHIGLTGNKEGDQVNNGADDDGSGTVAVLEIAEAFKKAQEAGYGPRRSILFANVTGEEKGLLGSAFYTDKEPVVPLEQTVANLNIDMIGRIDPTHPEEDKNYVYIIGSRLISEELHTINQDANRLTGIGVDLNERFNSIHDPNRFYARSDHWNFGKHNIPFIFFFTGTHEDYHKPGDEADKIEYERMAGITQMIFATAWQVANQDVRPAVSGEGFN